MFLSERLPGTLLEYSSVRITFPAFQHIPVLSFISFFFFNMLFKKILEKEEGRGRKKETHIDVREKHRLMASRMKHEWRWSLQPTRAHTLTRN